MNVICLDSCFLEILKINMNAGTVCIHFYIHNSFLDSDSPKYITMCLLLVFFVCPVYSINNQNSEKRRHKIHSKKEIHVGFFNNESFMSIKHDNSEVIEFSIVATWNLDSLLSHMDASFLSRYVNHCRGW